ncbi:MAG: BLUF domain-containing protein [Frankiales bacterium]|nr:BLUF domain-containing protein [Frankiales bacterium]
MDEATELDEALVCRLVYRSRSLIPGAGRRAELGELFTQARSHNKSHGISGALLVLDDVFVQTLEGDEPVVAALLGRIRKDPRHDRLEVLDTGIVNGRVFARWSMAKVATDGHSPDINLIAHQKGISSAASRGDATEHQEAVLEVMRDAARTAVTTS